MKNFTDWLAHRPILENYGHTVYKIYLHLLNRQNEINGGRFYRTEEEARNEAYQFLSRATQFAGYPIQIVVGQLKERNGRYEFVHTKVVDTVTSDDIAPMPPAAL